MARIFTACHGTQLLVIQHLRRNLALPPAREYLLWNPMERIPAIDAFMSSVIATAGFDDVLDMRDFAQLEPRRQGRAAWWFESARRVRSDAKSLRSFLRRNRTSPRSIELWTDDPIHFNVTFPKSCLTEARHVKFPHAFNLEDVGSRDYRKKIVATKRAEPWAKRALFRPWLQSVSACDVTISRSLAYDVAYTFDQVSPWSKRNVDVSRLISLQCFRETFRGLPREVKEDVEAALAPLRNARRPLLLLLLFGLSPPLRLAYQRALSRIFTERATLLDGCALAVKVHPAAKGGEEEAFFAWVRDHVRAELFAIRTPVNLELMLPDLHPDFVLAGPCGALPVVRRLGTGEPVVLTEVVDELCRAFPYDSESYRQLIAGMTIW